MNLLVGLFSQEPWLVDELSSGEIVRFAELAERLPPESEAAELIRGVRNDPVAVEELDQFGYLQVLTAPQWEDALAIARRGGRSQASEWVTMVPGSRGELGLTLPEDAQPLRRVSFFGRFDHRFGVAVRRVSIDAFGNSPARSVSVSSGHCDLPSRGKCAGGQCGACRTEVREAEEDGIVCVCPHAA